MSAEYSRPLAHRFSNKALLVEAHEPGERDERFAIWRHPGASILHYPRQVWVHVDYNSNRQAYIRAFPDADLTGFVLDHILNRRAARLKGFAYLRIVPISREANSSHGALSEKWSVEGHSSPRMIELNKASQAVVQYADLCALSKFLWIAIRVVSTEVNDRCAEADARSIQPAYCQLTCSTMNPRTK